MKNRSLILITCQLVLLIIFDSCNSAYKGLPGVKIYSDIPNTRTIESIKIGNQQWMSENLDVNHFKNGDRIPYVQDYKLWRKLKTAAYCYYLNNTENGLVYGKLYNWYAVMDTRGLAPEGWHIPTDDEWTQLSDFLVGEETAGGKMKESGNVHWPKSVNTANSCGFSALPNGLRVAGGRFDDGGFKAYFWSTTIGSISKANSRCIKSRNTKLFKTSHYFQDGLAVRLICDQDSCQPFSYSVIRPEDQENHSKIEAIKTGSQVWMKHNLEVSHYRNGDTIPQVQDPYEWKKLKSGAWCYNIYQLRNGFQVSKLYNWYAVNDPRGLAPEGWHIPTIEEWEMLSYAIDTVCFGEKSTDYKENSYLDQKNNAGINLQKFQAIPFGLRSSIGNFYYANSVASFWSSKENSNNKAAVYEESFRYNSIKRITKYNKKNGLSVRCVAD